MTKEPEEIARIIVENFTKHGIDFRKMPGHLRYEWIKKIDEDEDDSA